jgi:AbrB family looped-hinge helix DNA binding protein
MRTTVTTKGQVTIPVEIRKKFNIAPGTILDFDEKAEQLVAAIVSTQVPIRELIGSGKQRDADRDSLQWLEETRGAVALPRSAKKGR